MKFQWPRTLDEVKEISFQQVKTAVYDSRDNALENAGKVFKFGIFRRIK